MSTPMIATLFDVSHGVLRRNLEGLEPAADRARPQPGGNSLNWVVGHIVASRNGVLKLLGREPIWSDDECRPYARGSAPLAEAGAGKPWEEVLEALETSQAGIRAGFASATPELLGAPSPETGFPFPCETVADLLAALHFHESYHVGQTGTLRRLAGLEGAIR